MSRLLAVMLLVMVVFSAPVMAQDTHGPGSDSGNLPDDLVPADDFCGPNGTLVMMTPVGPMCETNEGVTLGA